MTAGIVTAGGGHGWEPEVVSELSGPGAPWSVVRRCADMADVLAVAATGQIVAAVLAADLRRLDSETVQQLASLGVDVVAVCRAGDDHLRVALERIGVAEAVPDGSGAAAILAAVERARSRRQGGPVHGGEDPAGEDEAVGAAGIVPARFVPTSHAGADGRAVGDPIGDGSGAIAGRGRQRRSRHGVRRRVCGVDKRELPVADSLGPAAPHPDAEPGRIVAVWGPGGAPGRSTVAMGLADRVVAGGGSAILIDADVYGGVLASAFGLLDESAGLAGACRLAASGRLGPADLAALCWRVKDQLLLLSGIARADRWPELRPSAIPTVLACAAGLADVVVVDCAAALETDEEITFDTLAPRRNGATLAVLHAADVTVVVGAGDPPGMERLARGYVDITAAADGLDPRVVINRVRSSAATQAELRAAVERFCGTEPVAYLPEDRRLVDLAWRRGVMLSEVSARSSLVGALDEMTKRVLAGG